MKPIEFLEQTVVIAKDQQQYLPFPAYRFQNDTQGRIVSCWKLSWRERLSILWSGVLWQQILTFHKPLQPQKLSTEKPEMP